MARGRKPKKLPLDYIRTLHRQGYSCEFICWKLYHEFGINVSRWTVWRRLRDTGVNFATNGRGVCKVKSGVDA